MNDNKYDIVISCDNGLKGALVIFEKNSTPLIFSMPVKKHISGKKEKNVYDMDKIVEIFRKYSDKKVIVFIERLGVRIGEGSVSTSTAGTNYGFIQGLAYGLLYKVEIISPQNWKSQFPELITPEMTKIKENTHFLGEKIKTFKKEKDKEIKKSNKIEAKNIKKEIDKLKREYKSLAKDNARSLATKLYPKLAEKFEKKNQDGLAEATLLGLYGLKQLELKEINNEQLVQDSTDTGDI